MPYTISFSDPSDPDKPNIIINDNIIDERLSVAFIGKNASNYSSSISKNFLHLLENFASPIPPPNPVEGQLWYNSMDDSLDNGLKIFDKTNWIPIGVVQKMPSDPNTLASSDIKNGDLFVDTESNQLYIKSGTTFTLVGPNTKKGDETSAKLLSIIDTTNASRSVLSLNSNNNIVAIVSDREFVPKSTITGFTSIKQGVNLSTAKFRTSPNINKFWGVSEKAESLIIGDSVVTSDKFLRSDVVNKTTQGFTINNNNGLTIGSSESLSISVELGTVSANNSQIYNKSSGGKISFRLTNDNGTKTVLSIEPGISTPNGKVGVNKTNPEQALDVTGSIAASDSILITGETNSTSLSTGSLQTLGGAAVSKDLRVGQNLAVTGTVSTGPLTVNGPLTVTDVLTVTGALKEIIAPRIRATDRFTGNLIGNASTATSLATGIKINILPIDDEEIANDIQNTGTTSITVGLPGALDGVLNLNLNSIFIKKRSAPTTNKFLIDSDLILISRDTYDTNNQPQTELFKLTGAQLLSRVAPPIGAITLWPTIGTVPNGYVPCDGRELSASGSDLYAILGNGYLDDNGLLKFRVPNLTAPSGTIYIIFTGRFI